MLRIYCPYCQEQREEVEFTCHGEAYIQRPEQPESITDAAWGDYLFNRKNPKGWHTEQWQHSAGCRKFFLVERSSVDHKIRKSIELGIHK